MSENLRPDDPDDVAGHGFRPAGIDAVADQEDDVQGHLSPRPSDVHDVLTDDVEGRRFPAGSATARDAADDEDDVSGHGLGPIDPKR